MVDYNHGKFGELLIQEPLPDIFPRYELVALHERVHTYSTIVVTVKDENGQPLPGVEVCWYWPDAPEDSDGGPLGGVPGPMKPGISFIGTTNAEGTVGFSMGRGSAYFVPNIGPNAVWIRAANSALVYGLGWIGETEHDHLDPEFRLVTKADQQPDNIVVYDAAGKEMPYSDVLRYFGRQARSYGGQTSDHRYELIALYASEGEHRTFAPRVLDGLGNPQVGCRVGIFNERNGKAKSAFTDERGYAQFALIDGDDMYNVPSEMGPVKCGIADGLNSEVYETGGVVNTGKHGIPRWLNPVFMYSDDSDDVEPPDGDSLEDLLNELETTMVTMGAALQRALTVIYEMLEVIGRGKV